MTGRVENGRVETEPLFSLREGLYVAGLGDPRRVLTRRMNLDAM